MFQFGIDPKYYKKVRIGLFQRLMTAITTTFEAVWRGLGMIISAPISGLNAFCIYENTVLDFEKLAEDDAKNPITSSPQQPDYFGGVDNREDWKREHDEEFGDEA